MSPKTHEESSDSAATGKTSDEIESGSQSPVKTGDKPVEVGGRDGPDPVRYGDWEKGGRCIDF